MAPRSPWRPPAPLAALVLLAPVVLGGCHSVEPPPSAVPAYAQPVPYGVPTYTMPIAGDPNLMMPAPPGGVPTFPGPMPSGAAPYAAAPLAGPHGAVATQVGIPVADNTPALLPNPLKVPINNHDYAWDQIVDVVSDFFPIQREQRVLLTSEMWTEGKIETPYQSGATIFEPHRSDTVGAFNRWQSTLQTIRRRAIVRVIPEADGYLIDLRVDKELEDLPQPERATAGAATFRTDNSLSSRGRDEEISRIRYSPAWIALGRDVPLEQKMLAAIRDRMATAPRVPLSITPVQ